MRFNPAQLEALRAAYSNIETMSMSRLPEFHELFDKCDNTGLKQLAGAGIKWVSKLAVNACGRRGIAL